MTVDCLYPGLLKGILDDREMTPAAIMQGEELAAKLREEWHWSQTPLHIRQAIVDAVGSSADHFLSIDYENDGKPSGEWRNAGMIHFSLEKLFNKPKGRT